MRIKVLVMKLVRRRDMDQRRTSKRRQYRHVQVGAEKRLGIRQVGRMSDCVVAVLADNGFAAALVEDLYSKIVGRRNPEVSGKMPDEFINDF